MDDGWIAKTKVLLGMLLSFQIAGCDIGELYGGEKRGYATNFFELKRLWTLRAQEGSNRSSHPTKVTELATERYPYLGESGVETLL